MDKNYFDHVKQNAFDDELNKIGSEIKSSSKLEKIALIMGYGRANPSDYGTIAGTNGSMPSQVPNKKRARYTGNAQDNLEQASYNAMAANTKNRFSGIQSETNAMHAHVRPEQQAAPVAQANQGSSPMAMPQANIRASGGFKSIAKPVGNLNVDVVAQGGMQNNKLPLKRWDLGMNERPKGSPATAPQAQAQAAPQMATGHTSKPGFFSREGTQQRMAANNARRFGGGGAPDQQMASAPKPGFMASIRSGMEKNRGTIAMAGWGAGARSRPQPQAAPQSQMASGPKPGFFSREATQQRMAANNARKFGGGQPAPAAASPAVANANPVPAKKV